MNDAMKSIERLPFSGPFLLLSVFPREYYCLVKLIKSKLFYFFVFERKKIRPNFFLINTTAPRKSLNQNND